MKEWTFKFKPFFLVRHAGAVEEEERMLATQGLTQFGQMPPTFTFKLLFANFCSFFSNHQIAKALNSQGHIIPI